MKIPKTITTSLHALAFISVILAGSFSAQSALASDATIFLSPITGTYITGTTFTLAVVVGSGGEAVNAIEGKLEYDPKEIEVVSTDNSSSVLTSWTIAPSFSNETGELSFAGLLSTSTVLTRGEVLKFTVRALRTGELHIRFANGAAVHAADGTGGNILTGLNGGVYVTAPKITEPVPDDSLVINPASPDGVPTSDALGGNSAEVGEVLGASTGTPITSSTHPDQEAWYATSTAVLNWGVPAGTSAIYLSFDKRSNGVGVNPYPASQKERIIRDIKDGVWYFHLTKEQTIGTRETVSYRIAVDTVNPTFTGISESPRTDHSVPNVGIMITASDTGSGIDHYEFILDEGKPSLWTDDGSHTRVLSGVTVGTHALVVVAVDRAGNRASEHLSFTVDNLPTPALTVLNSAFIEGDKIRLSLTSVPTAILDIHVARMNTSPATETFTVDDKGHGEFESALPLSPGSYTVSVVARTATGAISKESDPFVFEVNSSFIGVMKRHPMIPVAIISLILMVIGAYYYLRRMRESSDEEVNYRDSDDEEEVDEYEEEYTPPVREQVQKRPQLREGAVVLGKKEKIQMPATRL